MAILFLMRSGGFWWVGTGEIFEEFEPDDACRAADETDQEVGRMERCKVEHILERGEVEDEREEESCAAEDQPEGLISFFQQGGDCLNPGAVGQDQPDVGDDQGCKGEGSRIVVFGRGVLRTRDEVDGEGED